MSESRMTKKGDWYWAELGPSVAESKENPNVNCFTKAWVPKDDLGEDILDSEYWNGHEDGASYAMASLNFLLYDTLNLPDFDDDVHEFETIKNLVMHVRGLETAARAVVTHYSLDGGDFADALNDLELLLKECSIW